LCRKVVILCCIKIEVPRRAALRVGRRAPKTSREVAHDRQEGRTSEVEPITHWVFSAP
jgi:hypothetical protein